MKGRSAYLNDTIRAITASQIGDSTSSRTTDESDTDVDDRSSRMLKVGPKM